MEVINFETSTNIIEAVRQVKALSYETKQRVVAEFNNFLLDSNKSEEDNLKDYQAQWNKFLDNNIDWEQRRYEIAKGVLIGNVSFSLIAGSDTEFNITNIKYACKWAVISADLLIKELKKKEDSV